MVPPRLLDPDKSKRAELIQSDGPKTELEQRVMQRIYSEKSDFTEKTGLFRMEKTSANMILKKFNVATPNQIKTMREEDIISPKGEHDLDESLKIDQGFKLDPKSRNYFPVEHARLFLLFKPKHLISVEKDPTGRNRFTIFDFIRERHGIKVKLYTPTRLDYSSEGLMMLTDSPEMLEVLEKFGHLYEYKWRVKVNGKFTDEKLEKIRNGHVIKGKQIGPFYCKVKRQTENNTTLEFKTNSPKNRDIKMILQKNDLRIWKCVLIKYGPYGTLGMKQCDFQEVAKAPSINKFFFDHKKERLQDAQNLVKGLLKIFYKIIFRYFF